MNCIFITVHDEWLTKYVVEKLGRIYDCSLTEVAESFRALKSLGSEVYMINVRMKCSV